MRSSIVVVFLLILSVSLCSAGGNDISLQAMAQGEFEDLSKEVGLIISYVPLAPAEPLGILGFDIGVEVTGVKISSGSTFWEQAVADGKPPDYVVLPKIHVQKGFPLGLISVQSMLRCPGLTSPSMVEKLNGHF